MSEAVAHASLGSSIDQPVLRSMPRFGRVTHSDVFEDTSFGSATHRKSMSAASYDAELKGASDGGLCSAVTRLNSHW